MSGLPLSGRLLVATPDLGDPNFRRTVVLVLDHGDDGALGVVLNRPSGTALADDLPAWFSLAAPPALVFVGGPVQQDVVLGLARVRPGDDGNGSGRAALAALAVIDLGTDPGSLGVPVDAVRVFAGYAGWGTGQLEAEIAVGAWFVVDAEPGDALSPEPGELWRAVLGRQPGRLALFASFPSDPGLN